MAPPYDISMEEINMMETFRAARTRRTNARTARRGQRSAPVLVDDNTKALRGMVRLQSYTY